jgi:hypothetical protein
MIVSHQHRLIFVKTLKTAGTSIEMALAQHCGPDDIVTPIFPAVDGHKSQNWQGTFFPFREVHSFADLRKNIREALRKHRIYNHIPARFARARLPRGIWDQYLKVCVERNPWDKTLSHFHMFRNAKWHRHYNPDLTLNGYLAQGIFCHNAPFYCDAGGEIIVDRVLRYDKLNQDLRDLFDEIGIPFDGLPHAKSGIRKDRRSYHDVLDKTQMRVIEKAFEREIGFHGWEY